MQASRAGFCAIIGRPNVGKSTLMNRLLGQKLAVVTPKPQTTRNRILGVKNRPGAQIIYVDTPGIHKAKTPLNKYMVEQALAAVGECDVAVLLVEGGPGETTQMIISRLAEIDRPRILVINKIDLLPDKSVLLPLIDRYQKLLAWDEIIPISAATGDGTERLEDTVVAHLPEGPALYPEETVTDRAERFLAAELIREQAYLLLSEELPYSIGVTIESFEERAAEKDVVIDAVIHVERESQKRIVVGEGGHMVKEIGTRARAEIANLLGCPAHLKLFVKVDSEWTRTQRGLRRLGYH